MQKKRNNHRQYAQSLGDQVTTAQGEARMVLPGIQALFGFQLMVVFNQGFRDNLTRSEQIIHLVAFILVAISAILVVTPAAYHRQANHQISEHFLWICSSFLAWAMLPLALGSCADIYLVARLIVNSQEIALFITAILGAFYFWAWFLLPRFHARRVEDLPLHEEP